jgi:hypothetical protein
MAFHPNSGEWFDEGDADAYPTDDGATKRRAEKRRKVTVWCTQPVTLRMFRHLPDPDVHMAPDPDHEPVSLAAGANPGVDADFFAAWLEQNERLGLVASGSIHAGEPEDEAAEDAEQQPRRSDHMDVDAQNLSHHLRLGQFEAFVAELKGVVSKAVSDAKGDAGHGHGSEQEDEAGLDYASRPRIEALTGRLEQAIKAAEAVVDDHEAIMASFKPTFHWVHKKMAEEEAAGGGHGEPRDAAGEAKLGQPQEGDDDPTLNHPRPLGGGDASASG